MEITLRKVVAYLIGGIILLNGVLWWLAGLFSDASLIGASLIVAGGLLALPIVRRELTDRLDISLSTPVVIVLVLILAFAGNGWVAATVPPSVSGDTPSSTGSASTQSSGSSATVATATAQPESDRNHSVGESFQVGSGAKALEYTVVGTQTTDNIGGEYGSDASGTFLVVDLRIENVGDESVDLTSSVFRLVDNQGREYEVDSEAMIYLESSISFEQVNPGLSISGTVVFDVPPDQQGRQLRVDPAGIFSTAESHYVRLN